MDRRRHRVGDPVVFATDVAAFLTALRKADPTGGPPAGRHNFFRGGPPGTYDAETREAIDALKDRIPAGTVTEIWETALRSGRAERPVWFHGDVATGNLLVRDGRLAAVIDFGTSGVGDPACDVAIAWKLPTVESRQAFREALAVDPATRARGRGRALWKALITLAGADDPNRLATERQTLQTILTEYARPSEPEADGGRRT
ncbi:phosphotransferase [Actinoallomurus acaciae]|uniref:phosphotransferase n=1 Tax=Actinoallomurus acaciae TaxID=502577 RepID=UPI00406BCD06